MGETRHRTEVVEYLVEQHAEKLKDRLAAPRCSQPSTVAAVPQKHATPEHANSLQGRSFRQWA